MTDEQSSLLTDCNMIIKLLAYINVKYYAIKFKVKRSKYFILPLSSNTPYNNKIFSETFRHFTHWHRN